MKNLWSTIVAGVLAIAGAQAGNISNGLVVYLPFDNSYDDASGFGLNGTPVGEPGFDAGIIGSGALVFSSAQDGSSFNYVTLGNPAELNFGGSGAGDTSDFTVSFWSRFTTWVGDPPFISNKDWSSGSNIGWAIATDGDGRLQWNFNDGAGRKDYDGPANALSGGKWHHVVVSFQRAGNALTFLDGLLVNTTPFETVGSSTESGYPVNVGQDGTGAYTWNNAVGVTNAVIDDVGIWRRVLTGAEVAQIYRYGTNGVGLKDVPDLERPVIVSVFPADKASGVHVDSVISVIIQDGALALAPDSIHLSINGNAIVPTIEKNETLTTISYTPDPLLPYSTTNQVVLRYGDGTAFYTNQWQFVTVAPAQTPSITGQWDFNSGDLSATIGLPLEYADGPEGTTKAGTQFGTTASFGLPPISGGLAQVMKLVPASTRQIGYLMHHSAVPNGNGAYVNQYTLIMDILLPHQNGETWFSFLQTDYPANTSDGDLFARFSGDTAGIGIGNNYPGAINAGQWHRVAFAINLAGDAPVISKYIDGIKVGDQSGTGLDGRHSLYATAILFADEDGESQPAYVNSIQFRNYYMGEGELAALGGPSAEGIPTVTGQWDFENGDLAATIGSGLIARNGDTTATQFETALIGGQEARVMKFSGVTANDGYVMIHGAAPNGGGQHVNQYTLIMDLMYPAGSGGFRSLLQTSTNNSSDGDLFINGSHGIGISSLYQGQVTPDTWHRVAFTVDLTKKELGKFIDGQNVLTAPVGEVPPANAGPYHYLNLGVDDRWSLNTIALLFADEDGELAPGYVNSIQFRAGVLSPAQLASLGGASATGIPVNFPAMPYLTLSWDLGALVISWPLDFADYILESSPTLGPTAVWSTVASQDNTATVDPHQGNLFFRLRK